MPPKRVKPKTKRENQYFEGDYLVVTGSRENAEKVVDKANRNRAGLLLTENPRKIKESRAYKMAGLPYRSPTRITPKMPKLKR